MGYDFRIRAISAALGIVQANLTLLSFARDLSETFPRALLVVTLWGTLNLHRKGRADRASAPFGLDPPGLQSIFHKFFTLQDPSHRLCRFALAKNLSRGLEITFATPLSQLSQLLQRKSNAPRRTVKTLQNFKIMTLRSSDGLHRYR